MRESLHLLTQSLGLRVVADKTAYDRPQQDGTADNASAKPTWRGKIFALREQRWDGPVQTRTWVVLRSSELMLPIAAPQSQGQA